MMKYDPTKHHRRSIRLKGYDYHHAGAYFVTICAQNRECVLEDPIVNRIINDIWRALPSRFPAIELDEFVIMPNHVHFIVWNTSVGTSLADVHNMYALGDIVGAFKSLVFKSYFDWIKINAPSRRAKFWQKNYYEHIIRNDRELNAIRQYIMDNPANWKTDRDNLENLLKLSPPEKVEDYLEDLKELMSQSKE